MRTKSIKEQIKEYFFLYPTKRLRVREIERETKTPLPSVIRYTKELEEEKILKSEQISNIKVFSASRTEEYLFQKRLFNLTQIRYSGLLEFLRINTHNSPIIVFGSYSKGEDTEESDIDLYIESPEKKQFELDKFEKILNRNIQIFSHTNLKKAKNKELANNIINGVTLNGFIEVNL